MSLTYKRERDFWTHRIRQEVIIESDGLCDGPHWPEEPEATLAHVCFEIVAQVLAAPLRKAFEEHFMLPHGDVPGSPLPWRAYCDECRRLEALLPDGDKPIVIG